jgi:hypothetical protein
MCRASVMFSEALLIEYKLWKKKNAAYSKDEEIE